MIRGLLSLYNWRYPETLVYMLQSTEYRVGPYLRWYWHASDFFQVAYRRTLDRTKAARLLLLTLRLGMGLQILAALVLVGLGYWRELAGGWQFGLALVLAYPILWAHLVALPLIIGRFFIVLPRQQKLIRRSDQIFRSHTGMRLAIAGSYGKTSMKELLLAVLGERKKVVATPANKNVSISHAYFAQKLHGDEEVLLIEYGEGAPGDVARFARITHPTHAVITGIAPAHLDRYKTVERAAEDIFSLGRFVAPDHLYVNGESPAAQPFVAKATQTYTQQGALGWKVSNIRISLEGTDFTVKKGKQSIALHSGLIGRHQLGPLILAVGVADMLGLTLAQIKKGIAQTQPFEHRMQPYRIGGAWIIDDTYNGNIEGIRAGTALLRELPAQRKIYVSPGLVDQGAQSEHIHEEMGRLIAAAHPDIVVLMQNSATGAILRGLRAAGYGNEPIIEDDPLDFYSNLQSFVADGDVVLMQNDWTDNYT